MSKWFRVPSAQLAVAFLWFWAQGLAADDAELVFADPWVRALPPGMGMTAGFGTIRNPGAGDIVLKAFASPEFADVSLHRTEQVDGMSRMREVASLEVPGGGAVELAPGGYHLMLMKPSQAVQAGQSVTLEMTAEDGRVFRFTVPVERR